MTSPAPRAAPPSHGPQPLRSALIIIGALVVVASTVVMTADWYHDAYLNARVMFLVTIWIHTGVGLLLWWSRPRNGMGMLIVVVGLTVLLASLGFVESEPAQLLAAMCGSLPLAAMIHTILAFPTGRVPDAATGLVVVWGYLNSVVLQAPIWLFGATGSSWLPVLDRPAWADAADLLQHLSGWGTVTLAAFLLVRNLRNATAAVRRVTVPLYAYGLVAILATPLSRVLVVDAWGGSPVMAFCVQSAIMAGVPLAFLAALVSGRFSSTGSLEDLAPWLVGGDEGDRADLSAPLARVLGDPSLQVILRDSQTGAWLAADGAPVGEPGSGRTRSVIAVGDRVVGAIEYDPDLVDDVSAVVRAGSMIGIAVDRERLVAELLAVQHSLRDSRLRLLSAEDQTRRHVARDLHDGVQGRLVLLAIAAQQIARVPQVPAAVSAMAVELRTGIDATAAELRGLIQGVMPSTLVERGLGAGVSELLDRLPVPCQASIELGDRELPRTVEAAAWFMVSEALANVVKHADASHVWVEVTLVDDALHLSVRDNGRGGAVLGSTVGEDRTGLVGLAERIDVVGGTLAISSTPDGPAIVAEIPLQPQEVAV